MVLHSYVYENIVLYYVTQVRYYVKLDTLTYDCSSYAAAATGSPADNVTMPSCVSNYHGYYADDMCEYCCFGNLCNRDKSSSWIETDCGKLRSSAASVTVATVAVAMATVTSWQLIMAAM